MKVTLEITVDRLGVTPDRAVRIVRDHLPEYMTADGFTVLVERAKVVRVEHEETTFEML